MTIRERAPQEAERRLGQWIDEHYRPAPLSAKTRSDLLARVHAAAAAPGTFAIPHRWLLGAVSTAAACVLALYLGGPTAPRPAPSDSPGIPGIEETTLDRALIPFEAYMTDTTEVTDLADVGTDNGDLMPADYLAIEALLLNR